MVEHTYLGNYPKERQDDWTDECQGFTHDRDNWFITQKSAAWRVPVGVDLIEPLRPGVAGVTRARINIPGYDHFGDADHWRGRVYIPVEGHYRILFWTWPRVPLMAAFDAADLRFRWFVSLPRQYKAGWCAIDSTGLLYTSNSRVTEDRDDRKAGPLFRYRVEGSGLAYEDRLVLRDEHGDPLELDSMQGGTFADDDHLYISCGYVKGGHESWGLHLFDLRTQRRIARSTNGSGPFNYEFHPNSPYYEEPEGLTWWNLDSGRAPHISGQLHAVMLDNDDNGDDVYFKHYRVEGLRPGLQVSDVGTPAEDRLL